MRLAASRSARRGAASVEMALCMLVIVPVFLYALFLDDLLRYSLDAQETALSTVWDFTVQNYTRPLPTSSSRPPTGGSSTVQKHARLMFCDHESGKDQYSSKDCDDQGHHTALAAHVCWLNQDARQVTCDSPDGSAASIGAGPLHSRYQEAFTNGGLIRCSARAVVENYLLPRKFLSEFSDDKEVVDLTKEKWSGDIHANSIEGTTTNAYFLKEQRLAILTDTWALTKPADIRPGKKQGELHDRVANVYSNRTNIGYLEMEAGLLLFSSRAGGSLISQHYLPLAAKGDDPRQPNIAIKPHLSGMQTPSERIKQENRQSYYFNTEWRDWDQDLNRKTYEKRGPNYMGGKQPESY
jgi:hypothetical protein